MGPGTEWLCNLNDPFMCGWCAVCSTEGLNMLEGPQAGARCMPLRDSMPVRCTALRCIGTRASPGQAAHTGLGWAGRTQVADGAAAAAARRRMPASVRPLQLQLAARIEAVQVAPDAPDAAYVACHVGVATRHTAHHATYTCTQAPAKLHACMPSIPKAVVHAASHAQSSACLLACRCQVHTCIYIHVREHAEAYGVTCQYPFTVKSTHAHMRLAETHMQWCWARTSTQGCSLSVAPRMSSSGPVPPMLLRSTGT